MYEIKGTYLVTGETEIIDSAETECDAIHLQGEYTMAYGSDWEIWYE